MVLRRRTRPKPQSRVSKPAHEAALQFLARPKQYPCCAWPSRPFRQRSLRGERCASARRNPPVAPSPNEKPPSEPGGRHRQAPRVLAHPLDQASWSCGPVKSRRGGERNPSHGGASSSGGIAVPPSCDRLHTTEDRNVILYLPGEWPRKDLWHFIAGQGSVIMGGSYGAGDYRFLWRRGP
jgi:hypothetical protein